MLIPFVRTTAQPHKVMTAHALLVHLVCHKPDFLLFPLLSQAHYNTLMLQTLPLQISLEHDHVSTKNQSICAG